MSCFKDRAEARKKWGRCLVRPQDKFPAVLAARQRLNSQLVFPVSRHPHHDRASSFILSAPMLEDLSFGKPISHFVDSPARLRNMISHLVTQSQLSFDTESNHDDSFLSMICLIQISSATENFMVDVSPLYDLIAQELGPIFSNPAILKIVHDSNDVQLLQRDFQIFCEATLNMQEVYHLFKPQPHPISYSSMVKELFHIELDKLGQCADWRIRPIPKTMMNYAVRDSEHLLHAWDKVKRALLTRKINLSTHVFHQSIQAVASMYRFPKRKSYASIFDRLKSSGKRPFLGDLIPEGKDKFSK